MTTAPESAERVPSAERVLLALRDNAVALATQTPRPPMWIKVTAGDSAVEISWSPPDPDASPARLPSERESRAGSVEGRDVNGGAAAVREVSPAPEEPAVGTAAVEHIGAPTVGVFYRAPEPGAEPFVAAGDTIAAGQQVGIVEAMKLMIPVQAERAGRVVDVLVADATQVEYGEPLLTYVPAGH